MDELFFQEDKISAIVIKGDFSRPYQTRLFRVLMIITAFMSGMATADELHFATTEPVSEKKWQPKVDILKDAFRITLIPMDAIDNINKGIAVCSDYIKANPDDIEGKIDAYIIMAQGYFDLGEFQTSEDDRIKSYTAGRDAADEIIKLAPDRWEGWAWYAINLSCIGQIKGILKSLFLVPSFKKYIFHAEKLAPNSSLVLDVIGVMYRQLPGILGGNIKKSKKYLERAVEIDPHATFAKFDLALTLLEVGEKEQAKNILTEVVNEKEPSWVAHWQIWEKPKAEALLKDLDNYKKLLDEWHYL